MNSQPISVISEYKKLNLDFEALLHDRDTLDNLIKKVEQEKADIEDTLKATEFCYNQTPNQVNRQILDSTNKEAIKVKYEFIMLKILDLVSTNCQSYQDAKKKRERLLELIEARIICLKNLGIHILVEPFTRTKVKEQLDSLMTMTDNSQTISDIRREISSLNARTEEMTSQNNNYLISIRNTKDLIEDSISFGDIIIDDVELPLELKIPKEVADNQIIKVRDVTKLNMSIVGQKTKSVIRRVNQMINYKQPKKVETRETVTPHLIILPKKTETLEPKLEEIFIPELQEPAKNKEIDTLQIVPTLESSSDIFTFNSKLTDEPTESGSSEYYNETKEKNVDESEFKLLEIEPEVELPPQAAENNEELFETIIPFAEPTMFNDRTDEINPNVTQTIIEFPTPERKIQTTPVETSTIDTSMSESFWPTQESYIIPEEYNEDDNQSLSFDEQIDMLMSSENKVLKKVA